MCKALAYHLSQSLENENMPATPPFVDALASVSSVEVGLAAGLQVVVLGAADRLRSPRAVPPLTLARVGSRKAHQDVEERVWRLWFLSSCNLYRQRGGIGGPGAVLRVCDDGLGSHV